MPNPPLVVGYEAMDRYYCPDHFDRSKFSRSVMVSPIFQIEAESYMHCTICNKRLWEMGGPHGQTENL